MQHRQMEKCTSKFEKIPRPMGSEQKAESRRNTQEMREKLKAPKCHSECPKTSPRELKTAQNRPKGAPRRPQEEPKRVKKANPNRKTKKGPNQDDPNTVLDAPRADLHSIAAPPGLHLGGQIGTKTEPKTIKNRSEKSRGKNNDPRRSWTRLGAILGRLGCHLGALETLWHYACRCFVKIHFFDVKTVRRRFRGQLGPKKAPRGAKMTPRETQERPQNDPKSTSTSTYFLMRKPRALGTDRVLYIGPGPPPWEAPQGPRGGGPSDTGPAPRHPCAR